MFSIQINTDGAAFREEHDDGLDMTGTEVLRILEDVAWELRNGYRSGSLMDINGNLCGRWSYGG